MSTVIQRKNNKWTASIGYSNGFDRWCFMWIGGEDLFRVKFNIRAAMFDKLFPMPAILSAILCTEIDKYFQEKHPENVYGDFEC